MAEDVVKITEKLTNLYQDGRKKIAKLWERYDDFCEELDGIKHEKEQARLAEEFFREDDNTEDDFMQSQPPLLLQQSKEPTEDGLFVARLALAENKTAFTSLQKDIDKFTAKWNDEVLAVLDNDNLSGLKMQFEAGKEVPEAHSHTYSQLIPDTKKLGETLRATEGRLHTLPTIITEAQQCNSTSTTAPSAKPKKLKALYKKEKKALVVGGKLVAFRKHTVIRCQLCEIMFARPKKTWTLKELQKIWDPCYGLAGEERPCDWEKVYDAIKEINERVRNTVGTDEDLFIANTKTAHINPYFR